MVLDVHEEPAVGTAVALAQPKRAVRKRRKVVNYEEPSSESSKDPDSS